MIVYHTVFEHLNQAEKMNKHLSHIYDRRAVKTIFGTTWHNSKLTKAKSTNKITFSDKDGTIDEFAWCQTPWR